MLHSQSLYFIVFLGFYMVDQQLSPTFSPMTAVFDWAILIHKYAFPL